MSGVEEIVRPFLAADAEAEAAPPMRAKLFMHGGSQAVRLPKAFRFEGKEVSVRKEGRSVILEPVDATPQFDTLEKFFAWVDGNRRGTPEEDWPDPEPLHWRERDISW